MGPGAPPEADERASGRRGLKGVGVSGRQEGSDEIERTAGRVLMGQRHERRSGAGTGCHRPLRPNRGRGKLWKWIVARMPPIGTRAERKALGWLRGERSAEALDLRGDRGLGFDRLTRMRDHQALIKMHHPLLDAHRALT